MIGVFFLLIENEEAPQIVAIWDDKMKVRELFVELVLQAIHFSVLIPIPLLRRRIR